MNIVFQNMAPTSRVWIYQSTKKFTDNEAVLIKNKSADFLIQWTSHNQQMHASIEVFYNLFIVICVDERTAPASGCGIDKSIKFIKELEESLSVSLLDRTTLAYRSIQTEPIQMCRLDELKNLPDKKLLFVFNNLVDTKQSLEKNWEVPIEKSWHKQFLS